MPATFQPVKIMPETSGEGAMPSVGGIELLLRGGSGGERRLRIHKGCDRQLLIELVQALESLA